MTQSFTSFLYSFNKTKIFEQNVLTNSNILVIIYLWYNKGCKKPLGEIGERKNYETFKSQSE